MFVSVVHGGWRQAATVGALATTAFLLLGCSGGTEETPAPEVRSDSAASAAYLDAVCPVNAAWDAADHELDLLRLAAARGGDSTDLPTAGLTGAFQRVAEESTNAAAELDSSDGSWPADVTDAVAAVEVTLRSDAKAAKALRNADAAEFLALTWPGAAASGEAAAGAREALGIVDSPEAACARRADQRAEQLGTPNSDLQDPDQRGSDMHNPDAQNPASEEKAQAHVD